MKFYDSHMHSYLSPDSQESPFHYIQARTESLMFTDHYDFKYPKDGSMDTVPDLTLLKKDREKMKNEYGVELLLGVEIGYLENRHQDILDFVYGEPLDSILLSCHHNNHHNYMTMDVKESSVNIIEDYLNHLLTCVSNFPQANVLCHFDFGFRIHDISVQDLRVYEKKLKEIFKKIIASDTSFELNSKSLYVYHNIDLYRYAIDLYLELGGKLFTLSSDAHKAKDHMLKFEKSKALLQEFDVKEVVTYKRQEPIFHQLDELNFN